MKGTINLKPIIALTLILATLQPALGDSLLLDNAILDYVSAPFGYSSTCNWQIESICGAIHNTTKNGQMVYVSDSWSTISSVSIPFKRVISNPAYGNSTMTIRVYKSTTHDPATATLTLYDSVTISPSNTNIANVNFALDAPMEIHDGMGNKIVNYLFIELQETYIPDIDTTNEVVYGYALSPDDKYTGGKNYQYRSGAWTLIESYLVPEAYVDMAFKIYGSWYIPPTPPPVPSTTSTSPPESPLPAPSGTAPQLPAPDSGDGDGILGEFPNATQYCPTCQGNETMNQTGTIPADAGLSQALKGLGYCKLSGGCSSSDFKDFLYDFSTGAFVLSLIYILVKMAPKREKTPAGANYGAKGYFFYKPGGSGWGANRRRWR